ncbi:DUF2442 domain-containing protein [Calorimonas adulescens]|jgi:Protein of unknown function (DUF3532).|uniref:DUF2442 domain-containing protein n=1 Tax=Calorimonas adulescens TaxID=2606906 RepID=A0A5D8QDZ4_9THEO|nr:DUF2442 domain-containing protein [Calorimonas adulescens]TZE82389.1 DUF2442 domain-containing protein [Calorimonas adulescens]
MSILNNDIFKAVAVDVWFDDDKLYILLSDGREMGVPLEWFPKLKKATPEEKADWRLIGGGIGIRWEKLDEDISIEGIIRGRGAVYRSIN